MTRFRAGYAVVAIAVLAFTGCGSDDEPDVLSVDPAAMNLDVGQTRQLDAELRTAEGIPVGGAVYAWSSSAPAVATVSATGLVTAVTGGSATVTVSSAGQSQEVAVTVGSVATTIQVMPSTVYLIQGAAENLVVAVYNEKGELMPTAVPTFSTFSSNATVNPQGVVTAIGAGQGIVTVSAGAASASVPLVFTGHPAGVQGPRLALGSRPFGVAVARDSTLLATQLGAGAMGKGRTDLAAFTSSIAVGLVPTSVMFGETPDSAYVANQLSQTLGIVGVPGGLQSETIPVPGDPFRVLPWFGQYVFVATSIDSVFVVYIGTPRDIDIVARVGVGADPNGMALTNDRSKLYVTNMSSGTLSEVELLGFSVTRTITLGGTPQDVVLSLDGSELYVANEGGLLQVVDLASGNVTTAGAGTGNLFGLAQSPDGKVLVASRPGSGQVVLIDRVTRQVLNTVNTGGTPRRVAFDLLGSIAAVANEAGWVDLIR